jgi:hypothetical protein
MVPWNKGSMPKQAKNFMPGDVLHTTDCGGLICYDSVILSEDETSVIGLGRYVWLVPHSLMIVSVMPKIQAHGKLCLVYAITDGSAGYMFMPKDMQRVTRS